MSGLSGLLSSAGESAAGSSAGSSIMTSGLTNSVLSNVLQGAMQQGKGGNPAAGGMPQAPALGMGQPGGGIRNAYSPQQPTSLMEYYQLLDKLRR